MQIKKFICGLLVASYTLASSVSADEVVGRSLDQTEGQVLGGFTAMLIGGAVAGPFGALCVGVAGAWAGGKVQEQAGLSGERYQALTKEGELIDRRSPNHSFSIGEKVKLEKGRALPIAENKNVQQ